MDEEDGIVEESTAPVPSAGERLRDARKAKKLTIKQVADKTRIQRHHLESIEAGEFDELPSRAYALGFTRTYAGLVGLPAQELVDQVKEELADGDAHAGAQSDKFEPGDPARVPGRGLAWFAAFAALLLLGGAYAFYSSYFAAGVVPAPLESPEEEAAEEVTPQQAAAEEPVPADGEVIFTSEMDGTWVKFYDANGRRLYEAQMNVGESYTIPEDAEGPQIWTGRPYALAITIGGRSVPKISEEDRTVRDVPVTAEALLARPPAPPPANPVTLPQAAPASSSATETEAQPAPIEAAPAAQEDDPDGPGL